MPVMRESFRKKLVSGETLLGTLITLPSPEMAEVLAMSGFDWLFVDLEHSPLDALSAQRIIQAASPLAYCIVRCQANDEVWIKKSLDTGADGLIVPQVRSKSDAERVVRAAKYPPMGERSVGIARAQMYGRGFTEYVESANDSIAVIIQVEHREAVENIDSILEVSGIDCVFVGPYDLSGSRGKTGRVDDPEITAAVAAVGDACSRMSVPLGIFGATAAAVRAYIDQGFKLIAVGMDVTLAASAAGIVLGELRGC